jgi:CheY-like chemotaxis protein
MEGRAALRVVVADDEAPVRKLLRMNLEELGAVVEEARDGAELRALIATRGPFDIIITDIVMPRFSGLAVMTELRARGDMTPAIMISGHMVELDRASCALPRVRCIAKPFTPAMLQALMDEVLGSPMPPPPLIDVEPQPVSR